mmetsp:Transcript_7091/g.10163  ORF Transcript_7091/g.10163 Transcript_7091/m.10163 type:complete len:209 (+) Transcript_7091:33-659(+)
MFTMLFMKILQTFSLVLIFECLKTKAFNQVNVAINRPRKLIITCNLVRKKVPSSSSLCLSSRKTLLSESSLHDNLKILSLKDEVLKFQRHVIACVAIFSLFYSPTNAIGLDVQEVTQTNKGNNENTSNGNIVRTSNEHSDLIEFTSSWLAESSVESQDLQPESKVVSPFGKKSFGEWFILIYVVFSLLAGVKEFAVRFQNWLENNNPK